MPNSPHAVLRATLLLTVFACNGLDSDDSANTTATSGTATGNTGTGNTGNTGDFLSGQYPNDDGIAADPAVLFHDNFEGGWGLWDWPTDNTSHLFIESAGGLANGGASYLRSTVTRDQLQVDQYISSSTGFTFSERVDTMYFRFYARFEGISPNPHHWVRVSAGDANFDSSGWANNKPAGDEGFWFDFDINNDNVFNFYNYWYNMRTGRCNDGTDTPGCEGDQGVTYWYGNIFRPPDQAPMPRDEWVCIEMLGKTNTVGSFDGEQAFWIDGALVEHYKIGNPEGTWLRDSYHTGGCDFDACEDPTPFEGFDFRSSSEVRFKQFFLDAYYQADTFENKKAYLEEQGLTVSDTQTIYYDDVVVATERIGCRVSP
jgi:hypothetical protein